MVDCAAMVAADTNIIRNPTPQRYLPAFEDLRGRRIAILPVVDEELRSELPSQAVDSIPKRCRRAKVRDLVSVKATMEAAILVVEKW